MHFCPHLGCDYRGWPGLNNLRANGHPSGGPWRQFHCISCNGFFPEYHGTIFHGKQAEVDLIVRVLTCLAVGLGIRATGRVCEVDANTVLYWLAEAAEQLRAFPRIFSVTSLGQKTHPDQTSAAFTTVGATPLPQA
jgi:transposase-like protein